MPIFSKFHHRHLCKTLIKHYSITGNPRADKAISVVTRGRAEGWLKWYEHVVGLTEVRQAQEKVISVRKLFEVCPSKFTPRLNLDLHL